MVKRRKMTRKPSRKTSMQKLLSKYQFQASVLLLIVLVLAGYGLFRVFRSHAAGVIYIVPNQASATDPNKVIDPTGVKDSTAGLQAFLNTVPSGVQGSNNKVVFPDGAKYRVNGGISTVQSYVTFTTNPANPAQIFADGSTSPKAYPWRVKAISPNTDGRQSAWFMDEFGDLNNHATNGSKSCNGCAQGGFDGYLSGYQLDPSVGDTTSSTAFAVGSYYKHPFLATDVGKVITSCTAFGCMNRIIAGVKNCPAATYDSSTCSDTPDSQGHFNMVTWSAQQATQSDLIHQASNGWVYWAINTSKGGWECYFTPNPSFQPKDFTGSYNNFHDATVCATKNNRGRTVLTLSGHGQQWQNIAIHGSNQAWANSVISFDNSMPAVTEFQHDLVLGGDNNEIGPHVVIDDAYGDGIFLLNATHTWIHDSRIEKIGRQGITPTSANCGIIIERNVIQETHHSIMDFEPGSLVYAPGCHYSEDWFAILNNTIGGPHGIAANPGGSGGSFGHIKYSGNHSTKADVAAGTIASTAPFQRSSNWGSAARLGYLIFTNNATDAISATGGPNFNNWTHVLVAGNTTGLQNKAYFSVFTNSTDYASVFNKESCSTKCNLLGQLDPTSTAAPSSFAFNNPGTADADAWWAKGGPDPANYYRDNQAVTTPPSCDFNNDGHVNIVDLSVLAVNYGKTGDHSHGDCNGDGKINISDLSLMAGEFGK